MPELVGEMLKPYYSGKAAGILEQFGYPNAKNPPRHRDPGDDPYYEYRIRKLLVSHALGMQSSRPRTGIEAADGGYIIVKRDGDVLCYRIFDRGSFEECLIRDTEFDTHSVSRHGFARIYRQRRGVSSEVEHADPLRPRGVPSIIRHPRGVDGRSPRSPVSRDGRLWEGPSVPAIYISKGWAVFRVRARVQTVLRVYRTLSVSILSCRPSMGIGDHLSCRSISYP